MENKLVIFDYDGVIADSLGLWINAFDAANKANQIFVKFDEEYVASLDYPSFEAMIKRENLAEHENLKSYLDDILAFFNKGCATVKFFTGIHRLIENLNENKNIVCINTANDTNIVKQKLEYEGIAQSVADVLGYDIKGSKADKIKYCMEKYKFLPDDTFMIGDSLGDMIEGKKAGVRTIAVTYGWHKEEKLLSAKPNYLCSNIAELEKILKKSF